MAAEWIIKGETKYDLFGWDVARYGNWANKKFVKERVGDQYANRFKIHFPNEEKICWTTSKDKTCIRLSKRTWCCIWFELWMGTSIYTLIKIVSKPLALQDKTGGIQ